MNALTLEVILRVVFGVTDEKRLAEMRPRVTRTVDISPAVLLLAFGSPWLKRIGPWKAAIDNAAELDKLIYAEIAERRHELASAGDADSDARSDLMSILLQARDEDGKPMTDKELRDQLVTMLIAGHETTATSIAWAIERLVRTPAVLGRLIASLEAGETEYLDAVIKETLRIRPVVAQIARVTTEELVIDGWRIPPRTLVFVPMAVLHHDPQLFEDPQEFRPERFLAGDGPARYAWLPFGGGTRRCPGASLAHMEMRIVLTTMLRHVRLTADRPADERPAVLGATVLPERGARIIVTERRVPGPDPAAPEISVAGGTSVR
jgi:cytochrome P450